MRIFLILFGIASISCNRPAEQSSQERKITVSQKEETNSQKTVSDAPAKAVAGEMQIVKDLVANLEKELQICRDQKNIIMEPYSKTSFIGKSLGDLEFFSLSEVTLVCSSDELDSVYDEREKLSEDVNSSKYSDQVRNAFEEAFDEGLDSRRKLISENYEKINYTPSENIEVVDDENPGAVFYQIIQGDSHSIRFDYLDQSVELNVIAYDYTEQQVDRGASIFAAGVQNTNVPACANCHLADDNAFEGKYIYECSDVALAGAMTNAQYVDDPDSESYCEGQTLPSFHKYPLNPQDTTSIISYLRSLF